MRCKSFGIRLFLCCCFIAPSFLTYSQDLNKIFSPNLYDGTVNIQIPLYDQSGIGVSLSYNTKGVPVRELAGPAGLHWNLNVGGGISRTIKGWPDELSIDLGQQQGFDAAHAAIINVYTKYKGRLVEALETASEKAETTTFRDPESDEYTVSAAGIYFKFYIGREGEVFTDSYNDYEIRFFRDGAYRLASDRSSLVPYDFLNGFPISVTNKKTNAIYYFGPSVKKETVFTAYFRNEASFNYMPATEYFSGEKGKMIVNWKLDSVRYNPQELVSLQYNKYIIPGFIAQDSSWVQKNSGTTPGIAATFNETDFYFVKSINYPNGIQVLLNYDTVNTRIEFRGSESIYQNPPDPKTVFPKLDEVVIREGSNSIKYVFDYTYFHTPSAAFSGTETNVLYNDERDRYSLKLMGITQTAANGIPNELLYRFGYNNNKQRRFGGGLDFFGYYNGQSYGVAAHSIHPIFDKTDNATYAQYGLLNAIESGTGGKVEFKYGAHQLTTVNSGLVPVSDLYLVGKTANDGVRVDSIILTDVNNPELRNVTSFEYQEGQRFQGGGFCTDEVLYRNDVAQNANTLIRNIYEQFTSPIGLYNGSNHGYSKVKVTEKNKYTQQLSATEYTFSNFKDGNEAPKVLIAGGGKTLIDHPFTNKQYIRDWEMGLPLLIRNFDSKGLIVGETQNIYESITDTVSAQTALLTELKRVVEATNDPWLYSSAAEDQDDWIPAFNVLTDPYLPYRGRTLLNKVLTRKYSSNTRFMVDSIQYSYDSRYNVKSTLFNNSKGETIQQVNVYNYDLPKTTTDLSLELSDWRAKGVELLTGMEQWKMATGTLNQQWLGAKLLSSSIYRMGMVNDVLVTKGVYNLQTEEPIAYSSYTGMINPSLQNPYTHIGNAYNNPAAIPASLPNITMVQSFDAKGNVSETYLAESKQYKSLLFEQTNGKKVAEVMNARLNEIAYADFDQNVPGNISYKSNNIIFPNSGVINNPNAPVLSGVGPVKAVSGRAIYVLEASGTSAKDLYVNTLSPNKTYRLTFWATSNTIPQFGIESGAQFTLKQIAAVGNFIQYEASFTPTATGQKIGFNAAANTGIEDIRIHPVAAVMNNWYYQPLFGVGAQTDALGAIIYMEYDKLGRPVLTRDQDGTILSKTEYGIDQ